MKCPIKNLESECIQKECPFYGSGCGLADIVQSINQLEDQLDSLGDKIDNLAESIYEGFKCV
jgi:hypothetical protein